MADNLNPHRPCRTCFHRRPATGFFAPLTADRCPVANLACGGARRTCVVIAPTGSGKTLAAFLYALDSSSAKAAKIPARRISVKPHAPLYFTDQSSGHRRSAQLADPLQGIADERRRRGETEVNLRWGSVLAIRLHRNAANSPVIRGYSDHHTRITLSDADLPRAQTLRGVETVIIDEVHAVAGSNVVRIWR